MKIAETIYIHFQWVLFFLLSVLTALQLSEYFYQRKIAEKIIFAKLNDADCMIASKKSHEIPITKKTCWTNVGSGIASINMARKIFM